MSTKSRLAPAALLTLAVIISGVLAAGRPVLAQYAGPHWPPYAHRETVTPGPVHGYSGFVRYGRYTYYCDYQRIPNRTCAVGPSGRERCRVTSWTLKQYCY